MKSNVDTQAVTLFDNNAFPLPGVGIKQGVGQLWRANIDVSLAGLAAGGGNQVFQTIWQTPHIPYVIMGASIKLVSSITTSGTNPTGALIVFLSIGGSLQIINAGTTGNFSSGTYSNTNANRVFWTMRSDAGSFPGTSGSPTHGIGTGSNAFGDGWVYADTGTSTDVATNLLDQTLVLTLGNQGGATGWTVTQAHFLVNLFGMFIR